MQNETGFKRLEHRFIELAKSKVSSDIKILGTLIGFIVDIDFELNNAVVYLENETGRVVKGNIPLYFLDSQNDLAYKMQPIALIAYKINGKLRRAFIKEHYQI